MSEKPDTLNKFMVAGQGDKVVIMNFPPRRRLSREEALSLAAWIVALADPSGKDFQVYLDAVLET